SLLVDEARIPLVIAGSVGHDTGSARRLAALVASFVPGVDFDVDEYGRDVEYIVRDGRIGIIDELTGRVVADRHWPDGLQAALDAKEGLERQADGAILGAMTVQHFLRGYPRLCGMTGTAQAAAAELREMYGLDVVVIPTHRPMVRIDRPDVLFTDRETKERALVAEIRRVHGSGRPVLVGTLSVEESERLARQLGAAG